MRLAVILFCYRRPRTLKRALKTHTKIDADYYCFIDHSDIQEKIFNAVKSKRLYGTVYLHKERKGLNKNIIEGIDMIFHKGYNAIICLEDDLLISEDGLEWLKTRLEGLQSDDRYGAVSLSKGKLLNERFRCWGWGTFKHVWNKVDWSKLTDESWDVFLAKWMKDNQLYTRCGEKNRVKHIGHIGVHYRWYSKFGIRQYYRIWRDNYYRDKDVTMSKERFPKTLFRFIKDLTLIPFLLVAIKWVTRKW